MESNEKKIETRQAVDYIFESAIKRESKRSKRNTTAKIVRDNKIPGGGPFHDWVLELKRLKLKQPDLPDWTKPHTMLLHGVQPQPYKPMGR